MAQSNVVVGLGALPHQVIQRLSIRLSNVFVILWRLGVLSWVHFSQPDSEQADIQTKSRCVVSED